MQPARPTGRTLERYVLREIRNAFAIGIGSAASVLFVLRIVEMVDLAFARGVPGRLVLALSGYILPSFLETAVPMAALLGIVVAFARFSSDGELVALRASGMSLLGLLRPLLAFGVGVAAVSLLLGIWVRPWANRGIERTTYEMARTRLTAALRPGMFNEWFGGVILYVDKLDSKSGTMQSIVLAEERKEYGRKTIFAVDGRVESNTDLRAAHLELHDGSLLTYHPSGKYHDKTDFASMELNLDLTEDTGVDLATMGGPAAMKWEDLVAGRKAKLARGERAMEETIELHRKFVFPVAAMLLPFIGVPLGSAGRRGVRSRGMLVSVIVILLYYLLLTAAVTLARQDTVPVALAMWIPNLLLGGLGLWLFARSVLERPLSFDLPRLRRRKIA